MHTSVVARATRLRRAALLAVGVVAIGLALPALAGAAPKSGNAGDVWVDNVGQPPGPGHEMDPHLACANINLWGNGLSGASGTYTIDGWPPSGSQEQVYSGSWSYSSAQGGDQILDVIDVQTLIANATKAGDAPINKQGYHFKLQFVQDPQKHKTFWVKCQAPKPPPPPPPSTGYLEVCKKAASSAVTGSFDFAVEGKTYSVPVGACSSAIQVTAGNVSIKEIQRSGFALSGVTTSPSTRLVSVDLSTQTAVVKVPAGGLSTQTIATFTNKAVTPPPPPSTGYLEVCKKGATSAVTGSFDFVVEGTTYTVPVGACSPAIQVTAGNVTIKEVKRTGFALASVTTMPSARLVSVNLSTQTAVVKVPAGGVSTETIATFTNKAVTGTGTLKICEAAGSGVAVGTSFTFDVGGKTVTVPAGPAPGGYCVIVGSYSIGSHVTITQHIPTGDTVASIAVAPSGRLVSKTLATGSAVVAIGSGVTEVTYTDRT
jgi:hypothetical protein